MSGTWWCSIYVRINYYENLKLKLSVGLLPKLPNVYLSLLAVNIGSTNEKPFTNTISNQPITLIHINEYIEDISINL